MAYSASSGFYGRGNMYGGTSTAPVFEFIIANSTTLKLGDAVRVNTGGFLVRAGAGNPVGGVLVGLVDANGINVFENRATGTTGSTLTGDDTLATSSTNQSDATRNLKGQVKMDPAGIELWYNLASAALATTNILQFFDTDSNSSQIDVSSASDANGQFQLLKLDPDGDGNTSKGLFRINENQYGMALDSATAKVAA